MRLKQIQREPLCRHCAEVGLTQPGNTVDHIDGDSWNNEPANLQTLCTRCHTIKTNRHDGGLGNAIKRFK